MTGRHLEQDLGLRVRSRMERTMTAYKPREDNQIDRGILPLVETLRAAGIETFESCQGGNGHAYLEPTIRFHGDRSEGYRALAVALQNGLPVAELRRVWPINDGEPTGPWWELTFILGTSN